MKRTQAIAAGIALSLCCCFTPAALAQENLPPCTENLEFSTMRGTAFRGQLIAEDPEGEEVSFEITIAPGKGTITLEPDGSFIYTPAKGKRGKDYFGYRATDPQGSRSQEGTVIIRLTKDAGAS